MMSAEQSNVLFDKKGENNSSILSEMLEKLESRVLVLDQQIMGAKNDIGKEKESINQLEFFNLKNNEDFKNMLGSLQHDFSGKMEIKMTDLVNRLLLE